MPPADPKQFRVVAIGGGTGLSTLLRGLKRYVKPVLSTAAAARDDGPCRISQLSAIVTVTDDGGSSGRLRQDLRMLPPGDVRNCIAALSKMSSCFHVCFSSGFRRQRPAVSEVPGSPGTPSEICFLRR